MIPSMLPQRSLNEHLSPEEEAFLCHHWNGTYEAARQIATILHLPEYELKARARALNLQPLPAAKPRPISTMPPVLPVTATVSDPITVEPEQTSVPRSPAASPVKKETTPSKRPYHKVCMTCGVEKHVSKFRRGERECLDCQLSAPQPEEEPDPMAVTPWAAPETVELPAIRMVPQSAPPSPAMLPPALSIGYDRTDPRMDTIVMLLRNLPESYTWSMWERDHWMSAMRALIDLFVRVEPEEGNGTR